MIDLSTCLRFYKRKDIQEAMIEHAENKEVGTRYEESFGKRPDTLRYPKEILELALKGVTSFHCSEELWENPLDLTSTTTKKELDELRSGWDLVLDIDCKFIDYSKICADLIIQLLKKCGVKDISVKFSGNKGFHIGVPFQAFPPQVGNTPTKLLFPEAAKKIAAYVKENIKEKLGQRILEFEKNDFNKIKEKVELKAEEIISYEKNQYGDKIPKLNVDKFLEIDTILISPRHLYRMPYSLHEKSGLVSLPIDPDKIMEFQREMAHPDKILMPMFKFLNRNVSSQSATDLLRQSLDFQTSNNVQKEAKEKVKAQKEKENQDLTLTSPIREEFFPPCMKLLLNGMEDGKKRAVFCWGNFLGKIGWNKKEMETFLLEWNREKNQANPLRDNYITSQLRFLTPGDKLPPNCNNEAYYKDMRVCKPDSLCTHIKNPVNYTLLRWKDHLKNKEEEELLAAKEVKKQANELKKQERDARRQEREAKKAEKEKKKQEKEIAEDKK
ncbi:MAG: DNA primase small subunit domain-containing protein [Candidatus Woesearchaeota archaeon]